MGQRANMVVVRGGVRRLYYDHWCANRLDVELFWGPEAALAFIEQREEVGDDAWLDEVWAEGAALLDFDRRDLLFFGGEDVLHEVPPRRALLSLMASMWPGWRLRWASGGLAQIGEALGLPTSMFLADNDRSKARFGFHRAEPEWNDVLFTFDEGRGVKAAQLIGSPQALERGSDSLRDFRGRGKATLTWVGGPAAGGAHVDYGRRSLAFWWAKPVCAALERTAAAWRGWSVTWLEDRYEDHLALAGGTVTMPVTPEPILRAGEIARLRDLCHAEALNPARETMDLLGATNLNPATDEARGSVGDLAAKLAVLDRLAAGED